MRASRFFSVSPLPPAIRSFLVLVLVVGLTGGLTACDSGGSSSEDDNEEENGSTVTQTFDVAVETKTNSHPYSGEGDDDGYVIDGTQGKELTLTRGETYEFKMGESVGNVHPFYISTDEVGQGGGTYSDGVENNEANAGETLTFTPPSDAPDLLYYQCSNHPKMGWKINVTSSSDSGDDSGDEGAGGGDY